MSEKRRGLGRGLGALIPSAAPAQRNTAERPVDVFFPGKDAAPSEPATARAGTPAPGDTPAPSGAPVSDPAPATTDDQDPSRASVPGVASQAAAPDRGFTGNITTDPVSVPADPQDGATATSSDFSSLAQDEDLDGLLPVPGAHFAEIPVDAITPNPRQPRQVFDEEALAELVHSIREIGVLQPVVVRRVDAGPGSPTDQDGTPRYELVMGERRWRASQQAGLERVPAIVRDTQDDDLLRDALLENLHRSQLNPLEEAAAYQQLLDDFGCTHDELAQRIGRSRPQISNTLRLMKLPPLVQRRVAAGVLSAGHARALLGLSDAAAMERLAQRIVAEGLSVRTTEEIVALGGDQVKDAPARRSARPGDRHAALDELAGRLSDRFDTRVKIALGQRKGKLTVEFATVEDLNRIVGVLAPDEKGVFRD